MKLSNRYLNYRTIYIKTPLILTAISAAKSTRLWPCPDLDGGSPWHARCEWIVHLKPQLMNKTTWMCFIQLDDPHIGQIQLEY